MAIRLFFLLLVFGNLVFFAWSQGYLGETDTGHEPQRLAQQLQTDKLKIMRINQQSAAVIACSLINGLNADEAKAVKVALEGSGGEARIFPVAEQPKYLVLIPGLTNEGVADKKAAELRGFGVTEFEVVGLESGGHEIVLGRFEDEAAAARFLDELIRKRIKSAELVRRETSSGMARVEARASAPVLFRLLPKLIALYANAALAACAQQSSEVTAK